jgi:hypothetical protein
MTLGTGAGTVPGTVPSGSRLGSEWFPWFRPASSSQVSPPFRGDREPVEANGRGSDLRPSRSESPLTISRDQRRRADDHVEDAKGRRTQRHPRRTIFGPTSRGMNTSDRGSLNIPLDGEINPEIHRATFPPWRRFEPRRTAAVVIIRNAIAKCCLHSELSGSHNVHYQTQRNSESLILLGNRMENESREASLTAIGKPVSGFGEKRK